MDLYGRVGCTLIPLISSDLLMDCFDLASDLRSMDMRASPYDLRGLGYEPIRIETTEGKAEYVRMQRAYSERAQELRQRLIDVIDGVLA